MKLKKILLFAFYSSLVFVFCVSASFAAVFKSDNVGIQVGEDRVLSDSENLIYGVVGKSTKGNLMLLQNGVGVDVFRVDNKGDIIISGGIASGGYNIDQNHLITSPSLFSNRGEFVNLCLQGSSCIDSWSDVVGAGQWALSGSHIYNANSGNVGIGTTSPVSKLEVAGSAIFSGAISAGYGNSSILGNLNLQGVLSNSNGNLILNDWVDVQWGIFNSTANYGGSLYVVDNLKVAGGVILGNTTNKPVCKSENKGMLIFDTAEDKPYVCASSGWKPLDSDYDKDGLVDWFDPNDNSYNNICSDDNSGFCFIDKSYKNALDTDLAPLNIKEGAIIFGVQGAAPASKGYFVLTKSRYNGNLGGLAGANQKCLEDLKNNDWKGKSEAVLNETHVWAFLCGGRDIGTPVYGYCQNPKQGLMGTYIFASAVNSSAGGARFNADWLGYGPFNNENWSDSNHFGTTEGYWTGRGTDGTSLNWVNIVHERDCRVIFDSWTSSGSNAWGQFGSPNNTTDKRWSYANTACNSLAHLICIVEPPNGQ